MSENKKMETPRPLPGTSNSSTSNTSGHLLDRYTVPQQQGTDGKDSPYYRSQAPSIELPKGGGALKGIDEKFTVNAVNGTAALEVALPLTPGRNGFTPNLSLQYNSGSGNSEFGLGWSLGLPAIQRKTDKKLPEYTDDDVFLLAGAEDLVPVLDTEYLPLTITKENGLVIRRYMPRTDGSFSRIELIRDQNSGESWWRVTSRENMVTYYGLTAEARLADPADARRVFKWLPQLSFDHKGNVQQYFYTAENLENVPDNPNEYHHHMGISLFSNIYLKRVAYCNRTPLLFDGIHGYGIEDTYRPMLPTGGAGAPPDPEFLMELVLDYGEFPGASANVIPYSPEGIWHCRRDPFSDFHAGFEVRTYRRCYRALMFHRFEELTPNNTAHELLPVLVRSLDITYMNGNTSAPAGNFTEADLAVSFSSTGYIRIASDTYKKRSLPALNCDYQELQWNGSVQDVLPEDIANAPQGLTGPYQWIDMDGNGLPGILTEQAGGWFYKRNLGDGHFTSAVQVAPKPSLNGLGTQLQWQDLDANGRRQLVSTAGNLRGYYELGHDNEWQPFRAFPEWANIDWDSPYTKMIDLNGDGRPDVLLTEEQAWRWYENMGTEGYTTGGESSQGHDEEKGPRLLLNDRQRSIFLADMNGDGLTDIVRIGNGEVCYWPNLGYGRFGAKVVMSNAPVFDYADLFNPQHITLSDISGTGAPDLIYLGQNKCNAWINMSGNAWGEATEISPLPSVEQYSKIAVLDLLGSGTSCIVWSSPLPQHAHVPLRYMDLMGGKKPYLLSGYSNGMGKTTSLTYKHSTKYYLEDERNGTPWATTLPFPVHCVERTVTSDTVSETTYTQEYSYHHGYYDHEEREFRGFGRVDTLDTDSAVIDNGHDLDQKPVLTKTWYHTGAFSMAGDIQEQYRLEYRNGANWDIDAIASFPAGLDASESREAYRALKNAQLRQEVYAWDKAAQKESTLYTITANSYAVSLLQHRKGNKHASFRTHRQENVVWHCEWDLDLDIDDCDPRILHDLTLSVDAYGNILESAQVAYKRKYPATTMPVTGADLSSVTDFPVSYEIENGQPSGLSNGHKAGQGNMLVSYTTNAYTNDVADADNAPYIMDYRLRQLYETRAYQVHGLATPSGLWTVGTLKGAISAALAPVLDFSATPVAGQIKKRLLAASRTVYLKADASGPEPFGVQSITGIVYATYRLAFSSAMQEHVDYFYNRVGSARAGLAGYFLESAIQASVPGFGTSPNFWLPSGTMSYNGPSTPAVEDPRDTFYTPLKFTDPWGNNTQITYWGNYYLLPQTVTDAQNGTVTVQAYDWRCLQPARTKDLNNNISEVLFDTLCMPVAMAAKGKVSGSVFEADELGTLDVEAPADLANQALFWNDPKAYAVDLLGHATWRCVYDLDTAPGDPARVAMIAREQHYKHALAAGAPSPLQIRITYSDGFGRIAMQKAQAPGRTVVIENADDEEYERWVSSGKTVYNNKGKEVMRYEPYFSQSAANQPGGFAYDPAEQSANAGVSMRIQYDALGRAVRIDHPDGSFSMTSWDAWSQVSYDNNDTVAESQWYTDNSGGTNEQKDAAAKAITHNATPAIVFLDVLARPFFTVRHNRSFTMVDNEPIWSSRFHYSFEELDITGNKRAIHDGRLARTIPTLRYRYNMLGIPIRTMSADNGTQYILATADGKPGDIYDEGNRMRSHEYNKMRQLYRVFVSVNNVLSRLEQYTYGDDFPSAGLDPAPDNLRGKNYQIWDGANQKLMPRYDLNGNLLRQQQQVLADHTLADVPWQVNPGPSKLPDVFVTQCTYDALGRPVKMTDPGNNETRHVYDEGGMLKQVLFKPAGGTETAYVSDIQYDAKGQRSIIAYGNGTKTSYTYYPDTFRLRQQKTWKNMELFQDLNYWYDPVGNVTLIKDSAQQTLYFNNTSVDANQSFTYDALYRLIKATGRELQGVQDLGEKDNHGDAGWTSAVHPGDATAVQRYTQFYTYDTVGNIQQLKHNSTSNGYTRQYSYAAGNNRLVSTSINGSTPRSYTAYAHDPYGSIVQMPHLSNIAYNTRQQMTSADPGGGTMVYCQYDHQGQRMRKVVTKTGNIKEDRIYIGSYELYRKYSGATLVKEIVTAHIADDTGRIAMFEKVTVDASLSVMPAPLTRYIYSNHLGSASLELDGNAAIISYEEYHPYGTTAYQAKNSAINALAKRYRYTGKERDEETGFYYHGARYYIPWLCRWAAVDPMQSEMPDWSSYNYGFCNPITWNDPDGMHPKTGQEQQNINQQNPQPQRVDNENKLPPVDNTGTKPIIVPNLQAEQQVLMPDIYGNGHMGPQSKVEQMVAYLSIQHNNAIGENIASGPFGALGYLIGRDQGSAIGAQFDMMSQGLYFQRIQPVVGAKFQTAGKPVEIPNTELTKPKAVESIGRSSIVTERETAKVNSEIILSKKDRRMALAQNFFEEAGKSSNDLTRLLRTIDFSKSVKETVLSPGDVIWRFERINKENSEKHFFTDAYGADAGATSMGFGDASGYNLVGYEVTKKTTVLESRIRNTKQKQYFSTKLQNNIKRISQ